ncbi:MAG: radical SAM protein [archaeon]
MDDLEREKIRRLVSWHKGRPTGPVKIDIELHRRCNLTCLSCSRRADEKYGRINEFSRTIEMPKEKWVSIVREAAELGVREWHIAGGGDPPFVPEVAFPVIREIKKHGMYGILTTNGTNLSAGQLQTLVEIGWDRIHFSIDGPDAKTHDYLRGIPGTFDKATGAAKRLSQIKKRLKSSKPMINTNTVLSVKNCEQLPEMVRLARDIGTEYMFVEPIIIYSKWGEELRLTAEHRKEFPKYLKKAIALGRKYGIDSNFSTLDCNVDDELIEKSSSMHEVVRKDSEEFDGRSLLSVPCYDPWLHMTVKADGRVISCDVATDEGDSIRDRPLSDIWYGPYFERIRKGLLAREIPSYCAQCNPSHTTQRRWLRRMIEGDD